MKVEKERLIYYLRRGNRSILDVLIDHLQYSINDIESYEELTDTEKRIIPKQFFYEFMS